MVLTALFFENRNCGNKDCFFRGYKQLVNDDVFLCKEKLFGKTLDGRGLKLLFLKKNPVIGFNAVCFSGMGFLLDFSLSACNRRKCGDRKCRVLFVKILVGFLWEHFGRNL